MTKPKKNRPSAGAEITAGLEDAIAFARGEADPRTFRVHIPAAIDTRAMRKRMKMSQARFAEAFGLDLRTLQDWEQGRRVPTGAARSYLVVIGKEPAAVRRALRAA